MKFLYFLLLVMLGVSGFSAYKEGYLASVHPLLDPTAQTGGEEVTADSELVGNEEGAGFAQSQETTGSSSTVSASKAGAADKLLAKEEAAERARIERETRVAEREAKNAAKDAEKRERLIRKEMLDAEIGELRSQYAAINDRKEEGTSKMLQQERDWASQRIKPSDVDKQQLRQASKAYLDQLEAQMNEIDRVIREKTKLY